MERNEIEVSDVANDRGSIEARLAGIPRPAPVLSRAETDALTTRQLEILDDLTSLTADGFSHLTMGDLAGKLGCSLRTLYGIAPSRDLLVLAACDRRLWAVGRSARAAVGAWELGALDGLRRYLRAATHAIHATSKAFSADLAAIPGGRELNNAHSNYLVAVTKELLDLAVEQGEIPPVETLVVAHAMAGISDVFTQPNVIGTLPGTAKEASDAIVDLVLGGLTAPPVDPPVASRTTGNPGADHSARKLRARSRNSSN